MFSDDFILETNIYSACFRFFTGNTESDKKHREQYVPKLVEYIKDVFQYCDFCRMDELYNSEDCFWWAVDEWIIELSKVDMAEAIKVMCNVMYTYSYDDLLEYAYSLFDDNTEVGLLILENMEE